MDLKAILLVLIIFFSGCSYFITPSSISDDDRCTGFMRFPILAPSKITSDGFSIEFTNQTGRSLTDVGLNATLEGKEFSSNEFSGAASINTNATSIASFNIPLEKGSNAVEVGISYNDGDFQRTAIATCMLNVK